MADEGGEPSLEELLAQLEHTGAITITTPAQRDLVEHAEIDFITVIQLDGDVVMHVSERLLDDRERLDRRVDEHCARVTRTLLPLIALSRGFQAFQRLFTAALILVPQLGWMINAVYQILHTPRDLTSLRSLTLFSVGAVGAPLGLWVRRYSMRLFGWALRRFAVRAIPATATKLLTAARG